MSASTPPPVKAPIDAKELSTKFFGFSTSSFCNAVFTAVDDYIADGMDAMEVAMCPSFPDPSQRSALKGCNDAFIDAVTRGYDKNLDKFEIYVHRNILSIPEGAKEHLMAEVARGAVTPNSAKKRPKKSEGDDVSTSKEALEPNATTIPTSTADVPSKQDCAALDSD